MVLDPILTRYRFTRTAKAAIAANDGVALRQLLDRSLPVPTDVVVAAARSGHSEMVSTVMAGLRWQIQGEALVALMGESDAKALQCLLPLADKHAQQMLLDAVVVSPHLGALHQLLAQAPSLLDKNSGQRLLESAKAGTWPMFEELLPKVKPNAVKAVLPSVLRVMVKARTTPEPLIQAVLQDAEPSDALDEDLAALATQGKQALIQSALDLKLLSLKGRAEAVFAAAQQAQWPVVETLLPETLADEVLLLFQQEERPVTQASFLRCMDEVGRRLAPNDRSAWLAAYPGGLPQTEAAQRAQQAQIQLPPSPRRRPRA
jgi:hypothetical protein